MRAMLLIALGVATMSLAPRLAGAAVVSVAPAESVQAAIDAAGPGDVIQLQAGTYSEHITFASGEGADSVLDSIVVTEGTGDRGAGIYIDGASPTVERNIIFHNRARLRGSGIFVRGSSPVIRNNLRLDNRNSAGDPHARSRSRRAHRGSSTTPSCGTTATGSS